MQPAGIQNLDKFVGLYFETGEQQPSYTQTKTQAESEPPMVRISDLLIKTTIDAQVNPLILPVKKVTPFISDRGFKAKKPLQVPSLTIGSAVDQIRRIKLYEPT